MPAVTVALALLYWTRFPVPELSPSRTWRLPIGDTIADDPGLYWIVGPLMRGTGLDVTHAVWAIALAAFVVAALAQRTPLARFVLIVAAPAFIGLGGPYWIPAWAVFMALPHGPEVSGLIAVLVAPFRGVAALAPLAWTFRSWRVGVAALVGVVLLGMVGSHVLWHSMTIGLGVFPNPWGLEYADEAGMALTLERYASPEYESALRAYFISRVLERPDFFVIQAFAKVGLTLALTMPWCLALAFTPRLWLPALAALAPCVLVAPFPAYASGLLAVSVFALGSGDHARILRASRVPAHADGLEREQQPPARQVVVVPHVR
jgi:hypothetical protein